MQNALPVFCYELNLCDDLALDENILGKSCDLNTGAGGEGLGKILSVDAVNGAEIVHVLDENGGFHDLGHIAAGCLEQLGKVFEYLICLRLNTDCDLAGLGNDAYLTGGVDHVADYLRLGIRTDRCGSFCCRYGFHYFILHLINCYGISAFLEGAYNGFTVVNATDLAGNLDVCFVGAEGRVEPIVRNGNDICTGVCNVVEKVAETAGLVKQRNAESQAAVTGNKTLLDNALDKADVNIAAGKQAHHALALNIDLAL